MFLCNSLCHIESVTADKEIDSALNAFSDYSISQSPSLAAVELGKGEFECIALKNAERICSFATINTKLRSR
jgi:hypothetical protein